MLLLLFLLMLLLLSLLLLLLLGCYVSSLSLQIRVFCLGEKSIHNKISSIPKKGWMDGWMDE